MVVVPPICERERGKRIAARPLRLFGRIHKDYHPSGSEGGEDGGRRKEKDVGNSEQSRRHGEKEVFMRCTGKD